GREGARAAGRKIRRVADPHRRHLHPQGGERRAAATRVPPLPRARGRPRRFERGGSRRRGGRAGARAAPELARAGDGLSYETGEGVVIYPGTVIGDGCKIGDHAVLGKQPALSPRSTAKRE